MLKRARLWIRSVVMRRRLESEMQEEMTGHLERAADRLRARGLSAEDAAREARREFGNLAYLQEEARDARGTGGLDALRADCRFALRQFARRPATTLVMLAVLTVGMSISTLLFSFLHSYAMQPPPGVAHADDLVRIRGSQDTGTGELWARTLSEEELQAYGALTDDFAAVAGWTDAGAALDAGGEAERRGLGAKVTFVTENYFSVLGARTALGPGLPAAGTGDAAVAVIGFTAWDQLFGRRPDVVGSTVAVNGVPVTIVGVAPERFAGAGQPATFQLWLPLAARPVVMPEGSPGFGAVARLRPGVTREAATAATRVVAARAAAAEKARASAADGERREVRASAEVVPLLAANGDPHFDREVRTMSLGLGLLGALVLLVTCTNVSALLTGVATARRQEIAVRLSLGATRTRLVRQLLTESALLAFVAGAAALGVARLTVATVDRLIPGLPMTLQVTGAAAIFTLGVALGVGVLFGLSPALHTTRLALASALRDSSVNIAAARARLQRSLVVAQIALTTPLVVLLSAMLLFLIREYRPQGPDERADRVVTLTIAPPSAGAAPAAAESRARLRGATDRLMPRLRATPGVEAAVLDWGPAPPLGMYATHPADRVEGIPDDVVELMATRVGEGYFGLMGIPLVRGRDFAPGDVGSGEPRPRESALVIGADLARKLWGGADPVGRRLRATEEGWAGAATLVVVGIIDDPGAETKKPNGDYRVFLPPDTSRGPAGILLRTAASAEPLVPGIRKAAQEEAPGMAVETWTLAALEEARIRELRTLTGGLLGAGTLALLLCAIGLYAVVAFAVGQRTAEIAVRIAVGARARQIASRFIADGLRLSAIGLAIGLPISMLGLRALMSADETLASLSLGLVTTVAGLGVVLVAAAATWIPARRAASIDPAVVLRRE